MNWRRALDYLGTHVGAAVALIGAGYQMAQGSLLWTICNLLAAVIFWLLWKWSEER